MVNLKSVYVKDTNGVVSEISTITSATTKELPTPTITIDGTGYEYNGELLNYNRDQEVYKEYNNNRLLCEDIIRGIDMTKDKDEMLILALKAISLLIKDDYFGQRNLEKLN